MNRKTSITKINNRIKHQLQTLLYISAWCWQSFVAFALDGHRKKCLPCIASSIRFLSCFIAWFGRFASKSPVLSELWLFRFFPLLCFNYGKISPLLLLSSALFALWDTLISYQMRNYRRIPATDKILFFANKGLPRSSPFAFQTHSAFFRKISLIFWNFFSCLIKSNRLSGNSLRTMSQQFPA